MADSELKNTEQVKYIDYLTIWR